MIASALCWLRRPWRLTIGKDAHDKCASPDLGFEALDGIGGVKFGAARARKVLEGQHGMLRGAHQLGRLGYLGPALIGETAPRVWAAGQLRPEIQAAFPLERFREAMTELRERRSERRVVLRP